MSAKSADLFGTFLDTVSNGLSSSSATFAATTALPASPRVPPPPAQGAGARTSSNIANRVLKALYGNPGHMMEVTALLQFADSSYPALADALGQLQSFGLVTNTSGRIALSTQGVDVARTAA